MNKNEKKLKNIYIYSTLNTHLYVKLAQNITFADVSVFSIKCQAPCILWVRTMPEL